MIHSFSILNIKTQEMMTLGQDSTHDIVVKEGDVDWGSVVASHNTYSYVGQVGEYISSTRLRARDISVTGYAYYIPNSIEVEGMNRAQIEEYCYSKILDKKEKLSRLLNPTEYVRIMIGTYFIEGKPNSSVKFGILSEDNNRYFCKCSFSLYCEQPLFKKIIKTQIPLNGITPAFHFPLLFPKDKGIIMSVRHSYRLIAVENTGATEVGCVIKLKAKGLLSTPKISNIYTEESITINKTMVEGEEIVINTNDGKDRGITGEIDEIKYNYFRYWSFSNTWMKIPPGISLFGYSVADDKEELLEVSIELNPTKYNLEEM